MRKLISVILALMALPCAAEGIRYTPPAPTYVGGTWSFGATRGPELAPAITAANWTCGAGWDCSVAGTLNKNGDGLGPAAPTAAIVAVAYTTYEVTITVGALTVASGATWDFGGTSGKPLTAAGTFTDRVTAVSNASLIIRPTPTATRFTVTAVSVKALAAAQGDAVIEGNLSVYSPSTFYSPLYLGRGSVTVPAIGPRDSTNCGTYYSGSAGIFDAYYSCNGTTYLYSGSTGLGLKSNVWLWWSAGQPGASAGDLFLKRGAANVLLQENANVAQASRLSAGYSGYLESGSISEEITLSLIAVTTDSTANLLPANALIDFVTFRVTADITGGTATISLGDDDGNATRFVNAAAEIHSGDTGVGIIQWNPTNADAVGPVQAAASKIRITANAQPTGGKVRVQVFYRTAGLPSS
jgi:hypothetical protein